MEGVEINPGFEQVLNFVNQTNRLVFLTGKAGTGKTTLLKYIRKNTFKQMAVVAPTGVAAINAGGATIHSFFQFPFGPFLIKLKESGEPDAAKNTAVLKYTSQRLAIFRNLELLIIDEVSMVRADLLDQIDVTLRQTRKKWHLPFGGVQVLFIGDMYQLPPVVQSEEWQLLADIYPSPFFFESKVLRQNQPVFIELEKIYRQSNQEFIDLLNKVRNNTLQKSDIEVLNAHYKSNISDHEYNTNITLTTHNRKADEINTRNLNKLKTKAFSYISSNEGQFSEKNFPAEEKLVLKEGARVMFLKNNTEKNYYNGKIGVVSFLSEDKIKVIGDEDRREIEVGRETWTNVSYKLNKTSGHLDEEILGTFTQYPLRLAWAITIHKSQGLTFDKLIIDAAESFSAGQVYVALSRCKSLEGLTLSSKINSSALISETAIVRFSNARQNPGEIALAFTGARQDYVKTLVLGLFDFSELAQLREEFMATSAIFKSRLSEQGKDWLNNLGFRIENIKEVTDRFRNQLLTLFQVETNLETNQVLQERIQKASAYFVTELKGILNEFKDHPVTTESKEAADHLTPLLQQTFEEIFRKYTFIQSTESGFYLTEFVKQKLTLQLPNVKINTYASAKNVRLASHVKHPDLYRSLLVLRDEICEEEHKPIYMVASNKTLEELVEYLPTDAEELMQIKGFGEAKVAAYGDRFLREINDYRIEHDLQSTISEMPPATSKKKKASKNKKNANEEKLPKLSTKEQSYTMFEQGLSPAEIAKQRHITQGTVESHLLPYVAEGNIHINRLVDLEKQSTILRVIDEAGSKAGLLALKSRLPEQISYSDIKFVLASIGANG